MPNDDQRPGIDWGKYQTLTIDRRQDGILLITIAEPDVSLTLGALRVGIHEWEPLACASSRWRAPRWEASSSCPPKVRPTAIR
jgi:hypothetical protein